jgi:hypothetical protein
MRIYRGGAGRGRPGQPASQAGRQAGMGRGGQAGGSLAGRAPYSVNVEILQAISYGEILGS